MTKKTTRQSPIATALATITLVSCGDASTIVNIDDADSRAPTTEWRLVWSDEFENEGIDNSKWSYEVNCDGGGNNEAQCYTDNKNNAFIQEGALHIVALPAEEGAQKPYTSARLTTRYKADFKYGRFEMRAKMPSGQGSWPAFWMMPTEEVYGGWPRSGEIDIFEAVNLKVVDTNGNPEADIHGTLHYGQKWPNNDSSGQSFSLENGENPADGFHTYAVEWQEGEIRWYMNDYLYATQRRSEISYNENGEITGLSHRGWYTEYIEPSSGELVTHWDNAPFDQKFYLILNLAVGGNWPEAVNSTGIDAKAFSDSQSYQIDYVRVYVCTSNPETGAGCETVRPGYDSLEDTLVEGAAPNPSV